MQGLVDGLHLEDFAFFAWDARGHGQSPGARGHARGLGQIEEDMQAFLDHVCAEYGLQSENIAVIAHSVAAVAAGLWAVDYAPRLRGLVLATPALQVKLYVPLARQGLQVAHKFGLMENVTSYVRGGALTHDRAQARAYDQDPLISKQISVQVLLDLYRGAERLQKCAGNLEIPTQVLCARADWVVKNLPIRRFFRALPSAQKEIEIYRDFYHALFHEKDRHLVFADVRAFVLRCFERPVERQGLLAADRYGASQERYRWLRARPPWLSPRSWMWTQTRWAMATLGRLSQGLRLGLKSGFSSGSTLDYVYQNQARGWTPLGRMIDRYYLNSIGWVRVRQRRANLLALLNQAIELLSGPIRMTDLAGGPGRYLLDLLAQRPDQDMQVLVRDRDPRGLDEGRRLADARGERRIQYTAGDAFDTASVASVGPVDLAVVSGLYELFPDNSPLLASLAGLAQAVRPGGYLIYTNQPYHPQLELIAETLTHGDGSRWVMRCRSSAEMDELVGQAGFRKLKTLIDDDGIFSVSLAQRLA